MRPVKITSTIVLLVLTLFFCHEVVLAVPPLPSSFYGDVTINGNNVAEGTVVEAMINDSVISKSQTLMYQGQSVYTIDVNGDDSSTTQVEGGKEGDVIEYRVGGLPAKETGTWHSGVNFELNLTINAQATLQPPESTKTPLPTQTAINNPTQAATTQPAIEPTKRPTQTVVQNAVTQPTATIQSGQLTEDVPGTNANTMQEMPTSMTINEVLDQTAVFQAEQSSNTSSNSLTEQGNEENPKILEKEEKPNSFLFELIFVSALVILIVAGYLTTKKETH